MKQQRPTQLTVLVDSREKYPLQFPRTLTVTDHGRPHILKVLVEVRRLKTADYALEGYETVSLVERKGSLEEVWKNMCTADFSRFSKVLDRLTTSCQFPCLLLDFPIVEAFKQTDYCPDPQLAVSKLFSRCLRGGISLLWLPRSRSEHSLLYDGSLLLRWFWSAITLEGHHAPRGYSTLDTVACTVAAGDSAVYPSDYCSVQAEDSVEASLRVESGTA